MSELTRAELLKLIEENGGPEGLDLSGRDLSGIDLGREAIWAELKKVRERTSNKNPVWFSEETGGINLQEAILQNANLQKAKLWGANLQGAHLRYADLLGAVLHDANLQGVNVKGTSFQGANLKRAELEGAVADKDTIWPSGFWVPEGVVIEDSE